MAKIRIDKIKLSPSMSEREKIEALEKNLFMLECTLEHVLSNLSGENMSASAK